MFFDLHVVLLASRERPQFVPEDYTRLAKGMTNSRHGEVTYHREWSATAPAATLKGLEAKTARRNAGPLEDPGLRQCATSPQFSL